MTRTCKIWTYVLSNWLFPTQDHQRYLYNMCGALENDPLYSRQNTDISKCKYHYHKTMHQAACLRIPGQKEPKRPTL